MGSPPAVATLTVTSGLALSPPRGLFAAESVATAAVEQTIAASSGTGSQLAASGTLVVCSVAGVYTEARWTQEKKALTAAEERERTVLAAVAE